MRQPDRSRAISGPAADAGVAADAVEDLFIRNYDPRWGYDLEVHIETSEGTTAFESRYFLPPGHTASELDAVAPGTYAVSVVLDNSRRSAVQCTVDDTPDGTVLIECGNGAVSVSEGLYR